MGTVQGLTKERMLEIEAASVVDGSVDDGYHLLLVRQDGSIIDAGYVRGPAGTNVDASEIEKGIIELATGAEVITGTDTVRAVTPASLAGLTGTTTRRGLLQLATGAEALAFTDAVKAITPATLLTALNSYTSITKITVTSQTSIVIPCTGANEYEFTWNLLGDAGVFTMNGRLSKSGSAISAANYYQNQVYGGASAAGVAPFDAATAWRADLAGASRNRWWGHMRIRDLNTGTIPVVHEGTIGGTNPAAGPLAGAIAGAYYANITGGADAFVFSTSIAVSGYVTVRKINYT